MKLEPGLYEALEAIIKKASEPLTCVDLWEVDGVAELAGGSVNRVSDYLGNMWRRGVLLRSAAPKGSGSTRWAYSYASKKPGKAPAPQLIPYEGRTVLVGTPSVTVTHEKETITITLPGFELTVRVVKDAG